MWLRTEVRAPAATSQLFIVLMTTRRKNIMLGTAGHVDHGKTALVKLLTGCETDTLAEEKQRGLTIDLGFAPCRLADDRIVGVVDVPGHVDFIRNMVAGAHGVDVVIFVVAADDGIMPQTHEHLQILTLMGLHHGLVALTKIDLVPASRRAEVTGQLRRLLAGTFLERAPICPISNITGEGYEGLFEALNEAVNACEERPAGGVFRLWVEDVFTIHGPGTVITGIPSRGTVRADDSLVLLPSGRKGHVRRMQVYGEDATEARAGECVALNLPELDHLEVKRGMVLTAAEGLATAGMAEAELRLLGGIKGQIDDFIEAHLHVGTASVLVNVAMLEFTEMVAGQAQMVQLRLTQPLPLLPGERFVLRANLPSQGQSGLVTIGGGRILGVSNVRLRRKKAWTLAALASRREALNSPVRWCEAMVREAMEPMPRRDLQAKCSSTADELQALVGQLRTEGSVIEVAGGALVHKAAVEETARKLYDAVVAFHAANPQRAGVGRDELFATAATHPEVCRLAIESLCRTKRLEQQGAVFARVGWTARISDRDQSLTDQITAAFAVAGWAGPTAAELAPRFGQPPDRIEKLTQLLAEKGLLVRLDQRLFVHRDALESARQVALRLFRKRPMFSTMEFRDALGVSRKFAVPLLDYLDKTRFTVRSGHDRTPGVEAKKLMT
ncbi:MAG TPA: selenocysteine-specific translation elongation factor [Verrucomicrobiae bacterium]